MNELDCAWIANTSIACSILDTAPDGILIANASGEIKYANPALETMFGYGDGVLAGRPLEDLLPARHRFAHAAQRDGRELHYRTHTMGRGLQIVGQHRLGHEIPLKVSLGSFATSSGRMTAAFVCDLTEHRRHESDIFRLSRMLKMAHDCNETLVRAAEEPALIEGICANLVNSGGYSGVWVGLAEAPDCDAIQIVSNAGAPGISGEPVIELAMKALFTHTATLDKACFSDASPATLIALPFVSNEAVCGCLVLCAGNSHPFHESEIVILQELADDLAYGIDALRGRGERSRQAAALLRHQGYDDLTGLARRQTIIAALDAALAEAQTEPTGMLLIGINQFTRINDAYGHDAGDRLLVTIAERLQRSLRHDDMLARIGGDEFAVLLGSAKSDAEIAVVAERLRDALQQPLSCDGHDVLITATLGASVAPRDASDGASLLARAEAAMFEAKSLGRNSFGFFRKSAQLNARSRIEIERQLGNALGNGEFEVYYQPIVALSNDPVMSAEALIRWKHPQRGLISPSEFIPLAEDMGLIVPIGRWVIEQACRQIAEWRSAGYQIASVAVNLSARQFGDGALEATIDRALASAGLTGDALVIEVTESMLMQDFDHCSALLARLQAKGIGLSIDDFGTGYSSLAYLKRLPINWVKIDRSFVRDILTNPNDSAIAAAVVSMSHAMNLGVVAEGVETAEQFAHLRRLGCDRFQGYYFSPPIPVRDFTELGPLWAQPFEKEQGSRLPYLAVAEPGRS